MIGQLIKFHEFTELQLSFIQTIAVVIQSAVLFFALLLAYGQLKQVVRSSQIEAVNRMQFIIDSFFQDRKTLFQSFPLNLALDHDQFSQKPPGRYSISQINEKEKHKNALTNKQIIAFESLTEEQLQIARLVINRLNDLGQLLEDGFIPKEVFFGKYHLLIIRCCHLVEPVRRYFEDCVEGGNYGQRLLRLRHRAIIYNDIMPKHRQADVYIRNEESRLLIYRSPTTTLWRKIIWKIRQWIRYY